MTIVNYESALKNTDDHFGEPWSTNFCRVDDSGQMWITYGGIPDEAICITEGELEIYGFLDDENKKRVVEHLLRTRKPVGEWKNLRDVPYQCYKEDF